MVATIWSESSLEIPLGEDRKLTSSRCRCGAYFCYICGRQMGDEEACPCFDDVPPVYRLCRPSDLSRPSDDDELFAQNVDWDMGRGIWNGE
jgi:hypothetical protein